MTMPPALRSESPSSHIKRTPRRFIPPICLEHILLTDLINAPSPVTPQPNETTTTTQDNTRRREFTRKRMALSQIVNETETEPPPKRRRLLPDEPLTPVDTHAPNQMEAHPLPPLRSTHPPSPELKPLYPPLPKKAEESAWQLEALAALATAGVATALDSSTTSSSTDGSDPTDATSDSKKRKFVCEICNFGFHQAGGLRNHTNAVHLKQKPFACTWPGCGRFGVRGFAARGDLTRHVSSVHRGERKFRCGSCDMRFARRSVLVRHLRNIHKVAVPGRRDGGCLSIGGSGSGSANGQNSATPSSTN